MKKLSLLALAACSSLALFAQDVAPARTPMSVAPRFGIKGGVNLASLEIDDEATSNPYNTNSKTSFLTGAFVNLPLGGMLRLQPEVNYVGFGSKVTGTPLAGAGGANTIYEVDLRYLTVPIMFQYQSLGGFVVEAGPQVGFLTNASQENQNGTDTDIQGLMRKTDFALNGGIGYMSRIGLGLSARYVHGLSNVFNNDASGGSTNDREISNRGVQIGIVYQFGAAK